MFPSAVKRAGGLARQSGMSALPVESEPTERLWRERYPSLLRCAWLLTGSKQDAEDAVQNAWLACAPRLAGVERPEAYLHRAVVNACHGQHRRRTAESRALHRVATVEPQLPDHLVEFHDALAGLGQRARTVVVLRLFADVPDDEIAIILGCRPVTVRVVFHRAMKTLREVTL